MFVFPVFMLILFGYALNFDVTDVKIGVYDQEKSDISREFIQSLQKTGYFDLVSYFNSASSYYRRIYQKNFTQNELQRFSTS